MKLPLKNKRVLLTGASAGIGQSMAYELAKKGVKSMILVARREERLEALKQELMEAYPQVVVHVYPCDLSDTTAIDHLLHFVSKEVGAIDILINNAGFGDYGLFENASWAKTEQMLRLNIEGLTYLTHKLVAPMVALGRGGVLNVSSGLGLIFMPGMSVYSATKHYVTAFTDCLRTELRGTGVVVSQVCPGPVVTEFAEVAGNQDLSKRLPKAAKISAEQCAQEALYGFSQGKALIIPGSVIRTLTQVARFLPRPILRLAFSGTRSMLQKRQEQGLITS